MSQLMDFARRFVFLKKNEPLTFDGRPYLNDIYAAHPYDIVLRCSRQVEKSTYLANSILFELASYPGRAICYIAPRQQQSHLFSRERIGRTILQSPLLRARLRNKSVAKLPVADIEFTNGSVLYVRSAYRDADAGRGISIQSLYLDEFQDLAPDARTVMNEAMSHFKDARMVLAGTPKLIENPLEEAFLHSTQNSWTIRCRGCGRQNIPDLSIFGASALQCAQCQQALDMQEGEWVAKNPLARMKGYWINHFMVPWHDFDSLRIRQAEYDEVRFRNEVLGLPTTLGDHVISLSELEACCGNWGNLKSNQEVNGSIRTRLVAGVDWGGGGAASTAVCVGYLNPQNRFFYVIHFQKFRGREDPKWVIEQVAKICRNFGVASIAADAGNGLAFNRMLVEQYQPRFPLTAIRYADSGHSPKDEGITHSWTVDRNRSIGHLISRARLKQLLFPRFDAVRDFLEEFSCEIVIYNGDRHSIRYSHPPNTQDDSLHACNYALLQAKQLFESGHLGAYDGY